MIARLKRLWHADLARDPVSHAWILDLYRHGERHPRTVTDYFPSRHAPAELGELLERHRRDELAHETLYASAIRELGREPVELPEGAVFNNVIRWHTPASFAIADGDAPDVRTGKVAHFLAHAHHLEARIARSVAWHLEACERAGSPAAAVVAKVLGDEERHVRYTREWVRLLLPEGRAAAVLALHRRAEAQANLHFSRTQVRWLLSHHPDLLPRHRRALYGACAALMDVGQRLL